MEKYTVKKIRNQEFKNYIKPLITAKSMERVVECGSFLMFLANLNLDKTKLYSGNFCKNRFCPMCAWRLARKDSLKITILMEYIRQEHNRDFIFLTLTTPNVEGDKLEGEIKKYNQSFKKLMKREEVSRVVKGYMRKLEVTYDKDEFITPELYRKKRDFYNRRNLKVGDPNPTYDTYNPHFHVVIAVNKTYFTDTKQYISQDKWLDLWRESTGDYSITQVNVKKATTGDLKAVYEVAKYSAKDSDYMVSESVFRTFYSALKGKQLLVYGGLFKDAVKLFKNGQLDKYIQKDFTEYVYMLMYKWQLSEYQEYKKRELTEEERARFNKGFIDEIEID